MRSKPTDPATSSEAPGRPTTAVGTPCVPTRSGGSPGGPTSSRARPPSTPACSTGTSFPISATCSQGPGPQGTASAQGCVAHRTPKSAAAVRTIALPEFLGPVLAEHLERFVPDRDGALVFGTPQRASPCPRRTSARPGGGSAMMPDSPEIQFHDLRHAAATLAAQSGATLKDTMARLGHSTPRAALIYQHAASDRDEAIAQGTGGGPSRAVLPGCGGRPRPSPWAADERGHQRHRLPLPAGPAEPLHPLPGALQGA